MNLRPYQETAVDGVFDAWKGCSSTLLVMPVGTGKTVTFAHVIKRRPPGKALLLAHREELLWQGADKIKAITGIVADIEKADMWADPNRFFGSDVIVSSIQTQCSGRNGDGRMTRFDPNDFSLVVVDEAHHATAPTYRKVLEWYRQNPDLKVLGVTATPDRADEEALGQVFESVAYDYELLDAIHDGWLVPIRQRAVVVDGLDFSSIRTTAGDLNGKDLARVMEYEEALHGIAAPTLELAGDRKALVFAASVAHAERLSEIFNRHKHGSSRWVCGKTPTDERRDTVSRFATGELQFLCSVGCFTEGFDDPGVELIVMGRPTKSRTLYAQMVGRGTRPLPDLVDGVESAAERRKAIATSPKPACEVIDFVGNAGRHKLITTADILGGRVSDDVVKRAKTIAEDAEGAAVDMEDALVEATRQLEVERQIEAARRAHVRVKAKYRTSTVDPFDVLNIQPHRERGWDKDRQPTEKMIAMLEKNGIDTSDMSMGQARQLVGELIKRWKTKRCTFKQGKVLSKFGYDTDVGFDEASRIIDSIAKNGWKRPAPETAEATA